MVKARFGIFDISWQLTVDSPLGLGRRSHSWKIKAKILSAITYVSRITLQQRMEKGKANHRGSNLVSILQFQLLCFVFTELVLYPHNSHFTGCAHNIRANIFFTDNGFNPVAAEIYPIVKRSLIVVLKGQFNSCTLQRSVIRN